MIILSFFDWYIILDRKLRFYKILHFINLKPIRNDSFNLINDSNKAIKTYLIF